MSSFARGPQTAGGNFRAQSPQRSSSFVNRNFGSSAQRPAVGNFERPGGFQQPGNGSRPQLGSRPTGNIATGGAASRPSGGLNSSGFNRGGFNRGSVTSGGGGNLARSNNSFVQRNFGTSQRWTGQPGGQRHTTSFSPQRGGVTGGQNFGRYGSASNLANWQRGGAGNLHSSLFANSSARYGGHGSQWGGHGGSQWGGSRNGNFHGANGGNSNFNRSISSTSYSNLYNRGGYGHGYGYNNYGRHGNYGYNNFYHNRWNGGWNNWNNRSYFFGYRSPFGGFYRGYYPWWGRGFGWGFGLGLFPYYYGFGYPYYSFGYGYPYAYGYPYYSYGSYLNYLPYYGQNYYDYGTGYGGYASYSATYPNYAYGDAYAYEASPDASAAPTVTSAYPPATQPAPASDAAAAAPTETAAAAPSIDDLTAADFAGQAEINFKAGKYEAAARDFRHALVDDPTNAGVLMLLGQSLFALGQFDEAAGATAMALQALPQDKWGAVVENSAQLYGNPADYTTQRTALEKAVAEKPDSAGLHFLLGYHYAYSGRVADGIRELDRTIQLEPRDLMAKKLRDTLTQRSGNSSSQRPAVPPSVPPPPRPNPPGVES